MNDILFGPPPSTLEILLDDPTSTISLLLCACFGV